MGHLEISLNSIFTSSLLICLTFYPQPTLQDTRGEPVNVGLIVALPWDIANTLRAPLGGPISIALTVVAGAALTLGLLLAPVNYIFGYPSRIYHPARQPGLISDYLYIVKERSLGVAGIENGTLSAGEGFEEGGRSLEKIVVNDNVESPPDFLSSAFFFIPEEDVECRKAILCHFHGLLRSFPARITKFLRFFSKRSMSIPEEYKEGIVLGMKGQANCRKAYKCSKELTLIAKDILYNLISSDFKELWKLRKLF